MYQSSRIQKLHEDLIYDWGDMLEGERANVDAFVAQAKTITAEQRALVADRLYTMCKGYERPIGANGQRMSRAALALTIDLLDTI